MTATPTLRDRLTLGRVIEKHTRSVSFGFDAGEEFREVPTKPGWYSIATDAPHALLGALEHRTRESGHYQIAARAGRAGLLTKYDLLIESSPGQLTPIYNGHARNLQSRFREHLIGHPKTGCLALRQYETLASHRWEFRYSLLEDVIEGADDNRALRDIGEQLWRAVHGWPLLCVR